MKHLIILPAILAACATADPCDWSTPKLRDCIERVQRYDLRPEDCICERPTATLPAIDKRGDRTTKAPERPVTHDPVDDSGMFDGKEPARGDYDNERDYRDAHDSWKEGRG